MSYTERLVSALESILSSVSPDAHGAAELLAREYGSVDRILSVDLQRLRGISGLGDTGATYLRLVSELISRRATDSFKFGQRHTDDEIDEFFKARLISRPNEAVVAMTFDSSGRAIAEDLVSEGVVNASELLPRKVAEVAVKRGAAFVMIAHNHPHGVAEFSDSDMLATMSVAHIVSTLGVKLLRHTVVAGNESASINLDELSQSDNYNCQK